MKKTGLVVILGLGLLLGAWVGPAAAIYDPLGTGLEPFPALFGSAYRYDPAAGFFDTWIWLSLISQDGVVHIQFYDPKCTRTNDQTLEMTENETTLIFASEAAPDAPAGVFLIEAVCPELASPSGDCGLVGELWYLNLDDGLVFTRPLYTASWYGFDWTVFGFEHWDTIAQGFGLFATQLWLNCPTGTDGKGTSGNTALYDDLRNGRLFDFGGSGRGLGNFGAGTDTGASRADFVLYHFDESPGGSRDDVPCACLTDGPIETFSGLFQDFFGLVRVRFKTATSVPAVGLVHKTGGVPGLQIFDKRFHFVPFGDGT